MRGETLRGSIQFVVETCFSCQVPFAMTVEFKEEKQKKRQRFYCPNGHGQSYTGETDQAKLERVRKSNQHLKDRCDRSERSAAAYKGQATRLRNKYEPTEEKG